MLQNEFCTLVHEVLPCAQQPSVEVGDATWSGSGPCRSTINGAKAPGLPLDYARQMSACEGPSSAGAPTASLQSGPPAVVQRWACPTHLARNRSWHPGLLAVTRCDGLRHLGLATILMHDAYLTVEDPSCCECQGTSKTQEWL